MTISSSERTAKLLIALIGEAAAIRMMDIKNFGGTTIEFPKSEIGRGEQAFSRISEVIGNEHAKRVCKQFGGERLYIPNLHKHFILQRNKRIVASYNNGTTVNELVKLHEISDRWVREILKMTDMSECTSERQVSLF